MSRRPSYPAQIFEPHWCEPGLPGHYLHAESRQDTFQDSVPADPALLAFYDDSPQNTNVILSKLPEFSQDQSHRMALWVFCDLPWGYTVPHQQQPNYVHRHSASFNAEGNHAQPIPELQPPPHPKNASMSYNYYVRWCDNSGVDTLDTQRVHSQHHTTSQQPRGGIPIEVGCEKSQSANTFTYNSSINLAMASGMRPAMPENGSYVNTPTSRGSEECSSVIYPQVGN